MDNSTLNSIASILLVSMTVIGIFYILTLIFEVINSHNRLKEHLRIYREIDVLQEKRIENLKKLNNYLFDLLDDIENKKEKEAKNVQDHINTNNWLPEYERD